MSQATPTAPALVAIDVIAKDWHGETSQEDLRQLAEKLMPMLEITDPQPTDEGGRES